MAQSKRKVFIEHYLREFNATQAAIQAGYSERSAYSTGHRLLQDPRIKEQIEQRIAELKMSADEVLLGLADQSRASMESFVSLDKNEIPFIDLKKGMEAHKLHLVKKLKITVKTGNTNERTTEIELHDAQAAKVWMGKHHKLFTERILVDWMSELQKAGLDANAVEDDLTKLFKEHLTGGATGIDRVGMGEGEATG